MKLSNELESALKILIDSIPKNVKWSFSNGTAAFFYGSGREPTDIDIFTDTNGVQKISKALKGYLLNPLGKKVKNFFEFFGAKFKINEYEVEVYSDLLIKIDGKVYRKSMDDELSNRIRKIKINNLEIPVLSPEDVIASKALTQRGKEEGKHDIDDVKAILKNEKIDWKYLEERAKRMGGYDRIFGLLRYLGYQV